MFSFTVPTTPELALNKALQVSFNSLHPVERQHLGTIPLTEDNFLIGLTQAIVRWLCDNEFMFTLKSFGYKT